MSKLVVTLTLQLLPCWQCDVSASSGAKWVMHHKGMNRLNTAPNLIVLDSFSLLILGRCISDFHFIHCLSTCLCTLTKFQPSITHPLLHAVRTKARDNWFTGPHESLEAILKSRGVGEIKKNLKMLFLFFESA